MDLKSENKNLFFLINKTYNFQYSSYIYRYLPDRNWYINNLYIYEPHNLQNTQNRTLILNKLVGQPSDLIKLVSTYINEKQLSTIKIDQSKLHHNVSVVFFYAPLSTTVYKPDIADHFIVNLCNEVHIKYIDRLTDVSNDNILKLMTKLKSPINNIISSANNSDIVRTSSIDMAVIINDIIDLYRLKKNKLPISSKELNLNKFMEELSTTIGFRYTLDDTVPDVIFTDQKRLKQVLLNFVNETSELLISSTVYFENNDLKHKIDFLICDPDEPSEERMVISKNIINLLNGTLIMDNEEIRIEIIVFKNRQSFSNATLKKIKNKKIYVAESSDTIINKLLAMEMTVIDNITEADLCIFDAEHLKKYLPDIHGPYLIISTSNVETPRYKNNIIRLPIDDVELLVLINDQFL